MGDRTTVPVRFSLGGVEVVARLFLNLGLMTRSSARSLALAFLFLCWPGVRPYAYSVQGLLLGVRAERGRKGVTLVSDLFHLGLCPGTARTCRGALDPRARNHQTGTVNQKVHSV